MRLVRIFKRYGRFLDPPAHAQIPKRQPCVVEGAMQDLLNCTDALCVQAQLSLHRTKTHQGITDKLLLFRRHQPSI